MPVDGLAEGDCITISLYNETGRDSSTVQFVAVGDRYALVRYILDCSKNSLLVCVAALILILLNLIAMVVPPIDTSPKNASGAKIILSCTRLTSIATMAAPITS